MPDQTPSKALATPDVLDRNPNVCRTVVEKNRLLEKQLQSLGVDTRPHYTLSPPLGGAGCVSFGASDRR